MATGEYTATEIWVEIRAIDLAIKALLETRDAPLDYRIGTKQVTYSTKIQNLRQQRATWMQTLKDTGADAASIETPVDYEIDELGQQHGETYDRDDFI